MDVDAYYWNPRTRKGLLQFCSGYYPIGSLKKLNDEALRRLRLGIIARHEYNEVPDGELLRGLYERS